jgi:hypothetical protein
VATRRTQEEVEKLVAEIDRLREGGMNITDAVDKVGLAKSVYERRKRGDTGARVRGRMNVSQIPPRPKKGAKKRPKPVNVNDVASLANRISRIDKKLESFEDLREERARLSQFLLKLLARK